MPRIKIEFSDEVSDKLERLAKESPISLDRVLKSVTTSTKTYILASQIKTFGEKLMVRDDGSEKNATSFKKTGRTRYKLQVHPRFQVFEKGAFIKPFNAKALRFIGRDGTEVFAAHVRIPKKPFFNPGLRDAISADAINRAAMASIELEMQRLKLK
jgi:hypothetical protein